MVRTRETLTFEQLGCFLELVKGFAVQRYAETVTMAYTGMRSGEAWALMVDVIEGHQAHVRRTVSAGKIRDTTKTGWERHVYLPPIVTEAIAAHRRWLFTEQHRGLASGLLFPSNMGTPRRTSSLAKVFATASELAGLEITVTPQVLRRTFNTLMAEAGVNELVLLSQMGHADRSMTLYYFDGHMEAKREAWAQVFGEQA